jgi:hypothetical protein
MAGGFIGGGNAGMPAERAARQIFSRLSRKRAPARFLVSKSVFVNKLEMVLPDFVIDRLIALAFGTGRLEETRDQDGLAVPETQK